MIRRLKTSYTLRVHTKSIKKWRLLCWLSSFVRCEGTKLNNERKKSRRPDISSPTTLSSLTIEGVVRQKMKYDVNNNEYFYSNYNNKTDENKERNKRTEGEN